MHYIKLYSEPMKYPNIVFYRHKKYNWMDAFFQQDNVKDRLLCHINPTDNPTDLRWLFDPNYPLLVTFGETEKEYYAEINSVLPARMSMRWIHYTAIPNVDEFNRGVNYCFANLVNMPAESTRVTFSIFTTCYNSYAKIHRAYQSIQAQTYLDWEWVVMDDSPDPAHFEFLCKTFRDDKRVRLYKRSENSGNIGNVKNEVVLLCRGKYVLEMDHDDEIVDDLVENAVRVFEQDAAIGFVFSDCINIYEDGRNYRYSDFFGLGYEGYYCRKFQGAWRYVCSTANINNITLSHIVSVPNHARIWRKYVLLDMGNYSEFLPIADDYHILVRTAVKTKMAKLHKLGYIQYMNHGNNNFSLIRNSEINRLVPLHLMPHQYRDYHVHDRMKELDAYEPETYIHNHSQIWKRGPDYEHKFCNLIVNVDYDQIICIIGIENLIRNMTRIRDLYKNPRIDFLLLENKMKCEELWRFLDVQHLDRMKCYAMTDVSYEELERYFNLIYKSLSHVEIIKEETPTPHTPPSPSIVL